MRKIIAIGGGEIGRPGYPIETMEIDRRILEITGKSNPHVLFIPTASGDSESYCEAFRAHYSGRLGCRIDALCILKHKASYDEIRNRILASDAIYVGGGNTMSMLKIWRKIGLDAILAEAQDQGIVLSGLSAGAMCWFRFGCSDSRKALNPSAGLIRLTCLGFVKASICPHYDVELDRRPELQKMMLRTPGSAIALDNCSAIEIVDDGYRVLASKSTANAYHVYWSSGICHEEIIPKDIRYQSLSVLLG